MVSYLRDTTFCYRMTIIVLLTSLLPACVNKTIIFILFSRDGCWICVVIILSDRLAFVLYLFWVIVLHLRCIYTEWSSCICVVLILSDRRVFALYLYWVIVVYLRCIYTEWSSCICVVLILSDPNSWGQKEHFCTLL